ncbi:MAG: hydantoinase/oxoprolinase family protein, partial [Nitrospinota bacterium]
PRHLRYGIDERVSYSGERLVRLNLEEVRKALQELVAAGVESVAVCFLHSYANPGHEQEVARFIQRNHPSLLVSLSSDVLPEIGEFGRVSTTVANAYVQPLIKRYIENLTAQISGRGFRGSFFIMTSSGAIADPPTASRYAVRLIESGPAAGAIGTAYYSGAMGKTNVLSFDMGGTTAKMCLIRSGEPVRTNLLEVARLRRFKKGSGLLLKTPSVGLLEIGAGGGSIARIDARGLLAVGPESAGAEPGPCCYGRGGKEPTVTDADLILGYLNPEYFLGGEIRLDKRAAERAVAKELGHLFGGDLLSIASGIFEVVNETMANAIGVYMAENGEDARTFTLFAHGGAGPVHAWHVCRKLGIKRLVVPYAAGVTSAVGCLVAPLSIDLSTSFKRILREMDPARVNEIYSGLEARARSLLEPAARGAPIHMERSADMRYHGQTHEVTINLPQGGLSPEDLELLEGVFHAEYRRYFGREIRYVPIEAVNWRLKASVAAKTFSLRAPSDGKRRRDPLKGERPVVFPGLGEAISCPVYDREGLSVGQRLSGPAIIEERVSTCVLPPGAKARVDPFLNLLIEV